MTAGPLKPRQEPASAGSGPVADETPEEELGRLPARVHELEVETTTLTTERDILQRASKYFSWERTW